MDTCTSWKFSQDKNFTKSGYLILQKHEILMGYIFTNESRWRNWRKFSLGENFHIYNIIWYYYCFIDAIAPRSASSKGGAMPVLEGDTDRLEGAVNKGEGRATLRLKKDGQAVVEQVVSKKNG